MAPTILTKEAQHENAATLATILGLDIDLAAEKLNLAVTVTVDPSNPTAQHIGLEVIELLQRTISHVSLDAQSDSAAELVIGSSHPVTGGTKIYLNVDVDRVEISTARSSSPQCATIPPIIALLTACYSSAVVLYHATKGILPFKLHDPLVIRFEELGIDLRSLDQRVDIGHTYLAGAGAIGNGFVWAARYLNISGQLEIVDDDKVSSGNLNRQIWFDSDDISKEKAVQLQIKAQPFFQNLELIPRVCRLQDLSEKNDGPWLRRLIVAVDSRRARRGLQNEFPGEVFDASTTDIREIVLHYHRQPTNDACLSCIYEPDKEEFSREQHIADHLGISVDEVRTERISSEAAAAIVLKFTELQIIDIEGEAYDSFFRALCGTGQLGEQTDKRALAPFSFISVLAGVFLALELVRRLGNSVSNDNGFNYWRISPWYAPMGRRRVLRSKQPDCAFCGQPIINSVNTELWGSLRQAR